MTVGVLVRFLLAMAETAMVVLGLALLGFGLHVLYNLDNFFMDFVRSQVPPPSPEIDPDFSFPFPPIVHQLIYATIILGTITLVLGLLGCCAVFQSAEMVALWGLLLSVVLALEAVGGFFVFYAKDSVRKTTKEALRSTIAINYTGTMPREEAGVTSILWDGVMVHMECCGVDNFRDFALADHWIADGKTTIPVACCIFIDKTNPTMGLMYPKCPFFPTPENSNIEFGCFADIWRHFDSAIEQFLTLIAVLCVLELVAVLLSCCICSEITTNRVRGNAPSPSSPVASASPYSARREMMGAGAAAATGVGNRGAGMRRCDCMFPVVFSRTGGNTEGCAHIYCHHDFRA